MSGDTSAGGLARIDWTLTENVEGLILALGANDLLRGVDPAVTRANLDGILAKAEARDLPVLFAGIPAPGNYGPEYQAQFDAIFPELAEKHGATLFPNFLAGLGIAPISSPSVRSCNRTVCIPTRRAWPRWWPPSGRLS